MMFETYLICVEISGKTDENLLKTNSLYNTPPTFAIYMANLMFEWLKAVSYTHLTLPTKA